MILVYNFFLLISLLCIAGCQGSFSTLAPAGDSADIIANLFWWMLGGGAIIWLIFVTILLYALYRPHKHNPKKTSLFIIGGGVVFPIITLSVLLYFSLLPLPKLLAPAPAGSLQIEVSGVQWWWRVKYLLPDGRKVELANEIRLPVNEPVQFYLESEDVIHSFWIPSLAGKMDMIPGHRNMLSFTPSKIGVYGGACAEYCGESHSLMLLKVVVMEKSEFEKWLLIQQRPAEEPVNKIAVKGRDAFVANGCIACHAVRGVSDTGVLGPDLTHVGSRLTLGSGILSNNIENLHKWISYSPGIKPGVKMPSFKVLKDDELKAISFWLEGLK